MEKRQFKSIIIPVLGFTASGGNRVLSKLADHWIDMGLQVDFLVENESKPYFPTKARMLRCTARKRHSRSSRGLLHNIDILQSIVNLAKELKKIERSYDLIVASFSFTAIACYFSGCNAKTVYYVQAYDPEVLVAKKKMRSRIAALLAWWSFCLCKNQIVNSAHYLSYRAIKSRHIVPPGIDLHTFKPKSNPGAFNNAVIRVGMIGRRESYKVMPVLQAYRAMLTLHARTKLVIAYGNVDASNLIDIGDYEIVVPKDDQELGDFYRSCDIFLVLSEFRGGAFYPALETLATGTSLISNGHFMTTTENGWIIDKPEDAAGVFKLLLENATARKQKADQGVLDVQCLDWRVLAPLFLEYASEVTSK